MQNSLEVTIGASVSKRYTISLEPLLEDVREEVRALCAQEIDALALLKAYILKTQEYALICQSIESLYKSLETEVKADSVQIQSQTIENPLH